MLTESILGGRYARALLSMVAADRNYEELDSDFARLQEVIKGEPDLITFMKNPSVSRTKKMELVKELGESLGLCQYSTGLLQLLVEKERFPLLMAIIRRFRELYHERAGIRKIEVVSAVELASDEAERVRELVQRKVGQKIEIAGRVDPSILGGLVVRIDNSVLDGSLAGQLERMRESIGSELE